MHFFECLPFFADSGFENVWAVIPFDETHLACAFGDETDEQTKQLTKYFINKTFPIVYRVAPPVITDYRSIFNKLFVEAFGETENEAKETISDYPFMHLLYSQLLVCQRVCLQNTVCLICK